MQPSFAVRLAFLPATAMPFLRRIFSASAASAFASTSACLQSIMPAPVFSRRALTCFGSISTVVALMSLYPKKLELRRCGGCLLSRQGFHAGLRGAFGHDGFATGLWGRVLAAEFGLRFGDGISHDGGDQFDGADGVVVAGDGIGHVIGVAVGIHDGDDRHAEPL